VRTGAVGLGAGNQDDLCAAVGSAGMRQRSKESKHEQRNKNAKFHSHGRIEKQVLRLGSG